MQGSHEPSQWPALVTKRQHEVSEGDVIYGDVSARGLGNLWPRSFTVAEVIATGSGRFVTILDPAGNRLPSGDTLIVARRDAGA